MEWRTAHESPQNRKPNLQNGQSPKLSRSTENEAKGSCQFVYFFFPTRNTRSSSNRPKLVSKSYKKQTWIKRRRGKKNHARAHAPASPITSKVALANQARTSIFGCSCSDDPGSCCWWATTEEGEPKFLEGTKAANGFGIIPATFLVQPLSSPIESTVVLRIFDSDADEEEDADEEDTVEAEEKEGEGRGDKGSEGLVLDTCLNFSDDDEDVADSGEDAEAAEEEEFWESWMTLSQTCRS